MGISIAFVRMLMGLWMLMPIGEEEGNNEEDKNPSVLNPSSELGHPINLAIEDYLEGVRQKLARGENPNREVRCGGWTWLQQAVEYGCLEAVRLLLEHNADPARQRHDGIAALYLAARRGNLAMVQLLLEQKSVDLNVQDEYGSTPLCEAVSMGHLEVMRLLLARGANPYLSELHLLEKKVTGTTHWQSAHYIALYERPGSICFLMLLIKDPLSDQSDHLPDEYLERVVTWMRDETIAAEQTFEGFIKSMVTWFNEPERADGVSVDRVKDIFNLLIKYLNDMRGYIDNMASNDREVLLQRIDAAVEQLRT